MVGKNIFSCLITFTPEKKLLRAKFKKTVDDCYGYGYGYGYGNGYTPGTTNTIKFKHLPQLDLKDVDDCTTRHPVYRKIFKVIDDVEYKDSVTGYNHKKKLI